ncbi:hypothetical protein BT69DRAFT_1333331 [Atractiella rhizophila]|nr:hypothetical protein BT69DRAFT_1333331 [Atractiella rhizophila]
MIEGLDCWSYVQVAEHQYGRDDTYFRLDLYFEGISGRKKIWIINLYITAAHPSERREGWVIEQREDFPSVSPIDASHFRRPPRSQNSSDFSTHSLSLCLNLLDAAGLFCEGAYNLQIAQPKSTSNILLQAQHRVVTPEPFATLGIFRRKGGFAACSHGRSVIVGRIWEDNDPSRRFCPSLDYDCLTKVFDYLSGSNKKKATLRSCLLVSKEWMSAALHALQHSRYLDEHNFQTGRDLHAFILEKRTLNPSALTNIRTLSTAGMGDLNTLFETDLKRYSKLIIGIVKVLENLGSLGLWNVHEKLFPELAVALAQLPHLKSLSIYGRSQHDKVPKHISRFPLTIYRLLLPCWPLIKSTYVNNLTDSADQVPSDLVAKIKALHRQKALPKSLLASTVAYGSLTTPSKMLDFPLASNLQDLRFHKLPALEWDDLAQCLYDVRGSLSYLIVFDCQIQFSQLESYHPERDDILSQIYGCFRHLRRLLVLGLGGSALATDHILRIDFPRLSAICLSWSDCLTPEALLFYASSRSPRSTATKLIASQGLYGDWSEHSLMEMDDLCRANKIEWYYSEEEARRLDGGMLPLPVYWSDREG